MSWSPRIGLLSLVVLLSAVFSRAEDAFYRVPLKDLKITEGKLPEGKPMAAGALDDWSRKASLGPLMAPRITLQANPAPGQAEAYITYSTGSFEPQAWDNHSNLNSASLVVRAPAGQDIDGQLYVPADDWKSMVAVRFTVPASTADAKAREAFYQGKRQHYEFLMSLGIPGTAWFRHQAREAQEALGIKAVEANRPPGAPPRGDFEETYSLFSGGRALSENLQLDRVLLPGAVEGGDVSVAIESLEGITAREMDWKPLIAGKHRATDPLAVLIPIDQHAIFFPTFNAAVTLIDEADRQGAPVLQFAEPRSEDARTKERYQRQLCLSLTGVGRLLGPRVINSIAFTGSDPYLRVGSDVAILFEARDTATLHNLLVGQMTAANAAAGLAGIHAAAVSGKAGAIDYAGFVSPDRRVCAYLATVGKAVVVTNSLVQLQRLADVEAGRVKAIDTAPEYTYFRDRYKRGDADEQALVVLTDATIRRWCSPKWRIADSRRTRAAAIMSELQAYYLNDLATGKVEDGPIHTDHGLATAGNLRLTPAGVTSSIYGTLEFMTPICEMNLAKVSRAEADMYQRWRDSYQQNWRNYFDPIAVRLTASGRHLAADLTVTPLIAGTEYRQSLDVTKGAKILPGTGDPHGAMLHVALAVNTKSGPMRSLASMASTSMPGLKIEPLSWMGQTVAVYIDDDPIWQQAAKAENQEEFLRDHFGQIPIALYVQSSSALRLAAFLTGLHAFVDQSAPGMASWEAMKYNDRAYVKVSPTAEARKETKELENAAIYYTTAGGALLITPSEALLKRAMDRSAEGAAPDDQKSPPATGHSQKAAIPWLGDNLCIQINAGGFQLLNYLYERTYASEVQRQAWANLPILNEWKSRFPDRDPVDLHEQLWHVRLIDPAGGAYAWNPKLQTMESTVYGSPEAPKSGAAIPPALSSLRQANLGISFEDQGLRARVDLQRTPEAAAPSPLSRPAE